VKTDNLTVEIEESKRFTRNAKTGVVTETFRKSDQQRKSDDDRVYNQYTGSIIVAEAADLAAAPISQRRSRPICTPTAIKSAADCLADVLNNGGLRLAYGDNIKSQYKLGGTTNVLKIRTSYMESLIEAGNMVELQRFTKLPDSEKTAEAVKWYNERK
jgi:hypothetical protein